MAEKNKIVCVVNNYDVFNEVIKDNENNSDFEIISFDNRVENTAITIRYNDFIEKHVAQKADDFWVLFLHQDFGVLEKINLEKFDKNFIWGAIGAKLYKGFFFAKEGFKKTICINWGQILQGSNDFNFKKYGKPVWGEKTVDALDCCCMIVHSSLLKKYNLRFDEKLNFHMYAEDFCYRAKHEHKIKSKVTPIKCFHMGKGNLNEEFYNSANYLKEKFKIDRIPSTCRN